MYIRFAASAVAELKGEASWLAPFPARRTGWGAGSDLIAYGTAGPDHERGASVQPQL